MERFGYYFMHAYLLSPLHAWDALLPLMAHLFTALKIATTTKLALPAWKGEISSVSSSRQDTSQGGGGKPSLPTKWHRTFSLHTRHCLCLFGPSSSASSPCSYSLHAHAVVNEKENTHTFPSLLENFPLTETLYFLLNIWLHCPISHACDLLLLTCPHSLQTLLPSPLPHLEWWMSGGGVMSGCDHGHFPCLLCTMVGRQWFCMPPSYHDYGWRHTSFISNQPIMPVFMTWLAPDGQCPHLIHDAPSVILMEVSGQWCVFACLCLPFAIVPSCHLCLACVFCSPLF